MLVHHGDNLVELIHQFAKFGLVGVLTNLSLYIGYVCLNFIGLQPIAAMSITYAIGVLLSFWGNRIWTFSYRGLSSLAFKRFAISYGFGYMLNLGALFLFVEVYGLPHHWVQACMIFLLAILLFSLQKFWVFKERGISS